MSILDSIADIGLGPASTQTDTTVGEPGTDNGPEQAESEGPRESVLVRQSVTAKALYGVVSGDRVTVVKAPPGGGKTSLTATVSAHLANRVGLSFTIGCPRKEQAVALAQRLMEQVDPERIHINIKSLPEYQYPRGINRGAVTRVKFKDGLGRIEIRTLASLAMSRVKSDDGNRLLIIDEAYQATFAEAASAAANFAQVLMVGDPGQIGPVVTTDTGAWAHMKNAPHLPAPQAFSRRPDANILAMDCTYRLGQTTVDAIAPLYDFPFGSKRTERSIVLPDGRELAEIEHLETERGETSDDTNMLSAVARRAAALVGADYTMTDYRDGSQVVRPLATGDIAVVVAQNSQVSVVTGMLAQMNLHGIAVGTADRLQGGEWPAVVSLDPTSGGTASEHHLNPGRLCVMASRHSAHLTWVSDGSWRSASPTAEDSRNAVVGMKVRKSLTKVPATAF